MEWEQNWFVEIQCRGPLIIGWDPVGPSKNLIAIFDLIEGFSAHLSAWKPFATGFCRPILPQQSAIGENCPQQGWQIVATSINEG